jgi:hypothetical protein
MLVELKMFFVIVNGRDAMRSKDSIVILQILAITPAVKYAYDNTPPKSPAGGLQTWFPLRGNQRRGRERNMWLLSY